jgi:hypothetical protein
MAIAGYLLLPLGWFFTLWSWILFFDPGWASVPNRVANSVYALSRSMRGLGRKNELSKKADR